jgi:hypothetical protein
LLDASSAHWRPTFGSAGTLKMTDFLTVAGVDRPPATSSGVRLTAS